MVRLGYPNVISPASPRSDHYWRPTCIALSICIRGVSLGWSKVEQVGTWTQDNSAVLVVQLRRIVNSMLQIVKCDCR